MLADSIVGWLAMASSVDGHQYGWHWTSCIEDQALQRLLESQVAIHRLD
jgi:hypothetical protein